MLSSHPCPSCGETRPDSEMHAGGTVPEEVAVEIMKEYPKWSPEMPVCDTCIRKGRVGFLADRLAKSKGHLSDEDREILSNFLQDVLLPDNENEMFDEEMTLSERVSGTIAAIVASWYFPLGIALFVIIWSVINLGGFAVSPFPMVWLGGISAVLATLSALHGPFIMMSQRATFRRDRTRAQNDYKVNLRAELQIEYLSRQIQHLLDRQEMILVELQSLKDDIVSKR